MSKHTPGPWAVDRYCRDITPVGRYLRIAEIPGHRENDTPDSQEREANARLIAAAPDLLALVERLAQRRFTESADNTGDLSAAARELLKRLRATGGDRE